VIPSAQTRPTARDDDPCDTLTPTLSLLLLLRLEPPRRQVLLLPDCVQPRRLGPHQDHHDLQAHVRVPASWCSFRGVRAQAGGLGGGQGPSRGDQRGRGECAQEEAPRAELDRLGQVRLRGEYKRSPALQRDLQNFL
jgi:hypothetical protein